MDEKMETAALKQELATAKHELAEARAYIRRRILAEADHARKESLARKIKHCDEIMEERDQALKERDEARAEVARLRELLACSYELTEFSYQEMASVLFDLPCNTEEPR